MLFERRFWEPIAAGEVTVTFRRWKRRQVVPGNRYRTPAGMLQVTALDVVAVADITPADARACGYPTVDALVGDLRGSPELPIYRVRFQTVAGPDPRAVLAGSSMLTDADLAELDGRLARLDRAGSHGPWTAEVKNLGLTLSLDVGYRLSPRGESYLARLGTPG